MSFTDDAVGVFTTQDSVTCF